EVAARLEVLQCRAREAFDVDAGIRVEAGVFGGDGGVLHEGRYLVQLHTVLQTVLFVEELVEQRAVTIVDAGAATTGGHRLLRRARAITDIGVVAGAGRDQPGAD